jgi:aryl sulfotransferase
VSAAPVRYRSDDEDSARWLGFPFRQGDIVVSTRSRSGTTWMQMICALLVFQTDDLPAPLGKLSPWLDRLGVPRDELFARLAAQTHRRFIKTHTPLDGLSLDPGVTYVVVGRHPLDMAVSLYHHGNNLNRARLHQPTGGNQPEVEERDAVPRPGLVEWLRSWIAWDGSPAERLDSLPGVMWHLSDAWARRREGNVALVHYDDLLEDREGEMRRLADRLHLVVAEDRWPGLVHAAGFQSMRAQADRLITGSVVKDRAEFFRRGSSGAGAEALSADDIATYQERARRLAPSDLLAWLHRD